MINLKHLLESMEIQKSSTIKKHKYRTFEIIDTLYVILLWFLLNSLHYYEVTNNEVIN